MQPSETESKETPPKVVAAIPCFNEERFIGSVVAKSRKYADQVIVIDDGSTDDSAEVAKAAGAIIYSHSENRGYGAAICSALEQGRVSGADILVILDGDGQHDPKEIPHLIQPIIDGKADIVIGSRFLGKTNRSPLYRRLGQRALTTATNVASGHRITDSQSGCRAYSAEAMRKLVLTENGMAISSQMQFAIKDSGLRVSEVPINVHYGDKAKRNPVGHGANVLIRVLVLLVLKQPLILFGVPGLASLAIGLIVGLSVIQTYSDTDELAIGNALIAVMLCLAGLLGLFTALMLQAMKELFRGETSHLMRQIGRQSNTNSSHTNGE